MSVPLLAPHGGKLVNRIRSGRAREDALERARRAPKVTLDDWSAADIDLIGCGGFSPLEGFLGSRDYRRVVEEMRLDSGPPWSVPVTLPVARHVAAALREGQEVALVGPEGETRALLELEERYARDREREAALVYRTTDLAHPGVRRLFAQGEVLLAGKVHVLNRPQPEFPEYHLDPADARAEFAARGWRRVAGFQTRNPVHRAHEYIQKCAMEIVDGLFLHPLVGPTKADDVPAPVRMRCYRVLLENYYPPDRVRLGVLPAAMRYAGPREAILHALVRKNYGCSHFIVGRDHAGVGTYYGTYDAQRIFAEFEPEELGIEPLCFENTFYCRACGQMGSAKTCPHGGEHHLTLSGTRVREMLRQGEPPPPEFSRPEVAAVLAEAF